MFAHSQQWTTPSFIKHSKATQDIFVICDAFQAFERNSLVRPSPNTSKDIRLLSRYADRQLNLGNDPSGEEIHLFLSRLWRLTFEAARDWMKLFNLLGLGLAFQKPMTVLTSSALAPLKHYRNVIASLPNLLFALRMQEELSNSFKEHTQLSWMNWEAGAAGAIITALCEPLRVQVVEKWLHNHLTPLLPIDSHIEDEPQFWQVIQEQNTKLHASQMNWQALFPDTEINIDVYHS